MRSQVWTVLAYCLGALASPTLPFSPSAAERPAELLLLSEYFMMLSAKIDAAKQMTSRQTCDFANAKMPVDSTTPLPPVTSGLVLKHVALGRGTQNYTCGSNATAVPTAVGARAALFNATCIAGSYPELLAMLPRVALDFNLTSDDEATLSPTNLLLSGQHFFTNATTPFFNLDTQSLSLGEAPCAKNNSVTAPADAPVGQYNKGNGAVAWLKLIARDGATGKIEEVYRVNTAGGNPPATCAGITGDFNVQYSAEYWFWESPQ